MAARQSLGAQPRTAQKPLVRFGARGSFSVLEVRVQPELPAVPNVQRAVLDVPVHDRAEGTAATTAIAIANGADCIRVHDVKTMARVAKMTDAILHGEN